MAGKKFFFFGTDDPTLTIHVPDHCGNNCSFCVNKNMYVYERGGILKRGVQEAFLKVLEEMPEAAETVVISGGEPLYSFSWLEEDIFPIQFDNADEVEKFFRDNEFIPSLDEGIWEKSKEGYKEIIAWVGTPLEGGAMVPMLCNWKEGHEE